MSASSSFCSARRLALHPSALSDAEHALFAASLADLVDTTGNLKHVSVPEVDEILHLFAPRKYAQQRLVLHVQAGRGVNRGLAFVQSDDGSGPSRTGGSCIFKDDPIYLAGVENPPPSLNPLLLSLN
ncbi:hypothetical protein B0H17DRAFT_1194051 [Mycena rosella]|uniref:Uncharacterized protein n=1 Tax=Mycena rosella TaxID=1033263 RepID=A0AAD7GNY0_MYCRO|nr:hypothetical protein B0H17DRAFT_1194051 [Mycena rosella]